MNVQINRFTLEGCQCRIKFDPKELQELLHNRLRERVGKNTKRFDKISGELVISGAFTEIDEGNFALHFMLAFLGKARLACRANVLFNGKTLLDELLTVSAMCSCFTGSKSQLKYDTKLLADQIIKKTIKSLRS